MHHKDIKGFADATFEVYDEHAFDDLISSDAYEKPPVLSRNKGTEILFGVGYQFGRIAKVQNGVTSQCPPELDLEVPTKLPHSNNSKPNFLTTRRVHIGSADFLKCS